MAKPKPKFEIHDRVKVVRVNDPVRDSLILGFVGYVDEVEELPTDPPTFNYDVSGCYLNEYMLEKVD